MINTATNRIANDIPDQAGISLKAAHVDTIIRQQPDLGWVEVHPENYMVAGGPRHAMLEAIRENYPLSMHGVALSLGGAERLDRDHLNALRQLVDRYQPDLVSEHLAWSARDGVYFADLLPLPLNAETLTEFSANIDEAQEALKRPILIENPSHYFPLPQSDIPEPAFLSEIAERTGCSLLVDVNNIYVSAVNLGSDAEAYVDALPVDLIGEIHLAGHVRDQADARLLIDNHGAPVADDVWALFERLIARTGPRPTLIEWDSDIPPLPVLQAEAQKAQGRLSLLDPVQGISQ